MSTNRRRFLPKTRAFNERMIERTMDSWGLGLSSDAIRTPENGLEELENARDHKSEIRGRRGTLLHVRADYSVIPNGDPFATAIAPGGRIYDAKGSDPAEGDVFITEGTYDFQGSLKLAKSEALQSNALSAPIRTYPKTFALDYYEIKDNGTGTLEPVYLGNLGIPPFRDYYAAYVDGGTNRDMPYTKAGNTITLTSGAGIDSGKDFDENVVGNYFSYGAKLDGSASESSEVKRDLIVSVNSAQSIVVANSDTVADGDYVGCSVSPKINGSFFHQGNKKLYILAGEDLYETDNLIRTWTKIPGVYDKKPFNSESLFHEAGNDIILTNANGRYRISLTEGKVHFWKINSDKPNRLANKKIKIFGFKSCVGCDTGDNPYEVAGFSAQSTSGGSDKTGGQIL